MNCIILFLIINFKFVVDLIHTLLIKTIFSMLGEV